MSEKTGIEWTDHTWNPWYGCRHVSAGCFNCYMFSQRRSYGQDPETVTRAKGNSFNAPLKWKSGRVFTCSWSDFFISDADEWRDDAWSVIRRTPHLTYQILTKRPVAMATRLPKDWGSKGYPNVWIGVSVENRATLGRIWTLIGTPAAKRFVSFEPLLEDLGDISRFLAPATSSIDYYQRVGPDRLGEKDCIDWAIVGGESGAKARSCNVDWIRYVTRYCQMAGVPVFVKQLGAKPEFGISELDYRGAMPMFDRKGGDINEWPEDLRVREFPNP